MIPVLPVFSFFIFFLLHISFHICHSPVLLVSLDYFYKYLLLCLVSNLYFFYNKLYQQSYSVLFIPKKNFFFFLPGPILDIKFIFTILFYHMLLKYLIFLSFIFTNTINKHLKVAPFVVNIAMFFKECAIVTKS